VVIFAVLLLCKCPAKNNTNSREGVMQVTAKGRSESTRARNVKRVGRATFSHDFILRVAVLFGQLWVIEE
jgi:hypothetical protein